MSNELKPILSDENLAHRAMKADGDFEEFVRIRDLYELDRSKLMAVLQVCADALNKSQYVILRMADGPNREAWGPQLDTNDDALSQLKAIGIEPNK